MSLERGRTPAADPSTPSTAAAWALGVAAAALAALWSWHVSLWSDEAATISAATRSLSELWRLLGTIDAVHGTYYVLMHGWVSLTGIGAVALRLPSALAVGAAVAGTYVLVTRLSDRRTAMAAAIVLAVLPRMTWAGIEARPFALSIALAVWSTVALEVALRRRAGRWYAAYAVLLALATAVNLYVVLIAGAHAVTVLAQRDARALRRFALAVVAAVAATAPISVTALGQGGQLGERHRGLVTWLRSVAVDQWFLGETPTPTTQSGTAHLVLSSADQWWKLTSVALAAVCWVVILRAVLRHRDGATRRLLVWALPWTIVPTVLVVAAAVVSPTLYNSRYLGFSGPAVAILVAAGLRGLRARSVVALGVVGTLLVVPVYASQRTVTAKNGVDWVLAAAWLDGRTTPGDGVYFGPRDDLVDGVATRSLRTVSLAYPEPFTGLVDVTLLAGPVEGATLFGTSRSLEASIDRLDGLDRVWVLRREDRPADAAVEDRLLSEAGFAVVDRWLGPQTEVLELER